MFAGPARLILFLQDLAVCKHCQNFFSTKIAFPGYGGL